MSWTDGLLTAGATLAQGGGGTGGEGGVSMLEFVRSGGAVGYVIILLSLVAVTLAVVHLLQIRSSSLAPLRVQEDLHGLLGAGRVDEASGYCDEPDNACFLANVVGAGLSRYRRSPFGALELKGALEEAGRDQVARLYRSTDALALIAGIAPMLGLLGTVVGINGAFATISSAEGFARPDQLAGDISLALVTTIMGLTLAIPTTAAVTFFRNRIDGLAAEAAQVVDELAMHLEEGAAGGGQPAGPPAGPTASPAGGGPA